MDLTGKALSPRQVRDELLEIRSRLSFCIASIAAWKEKSKNIEAISITPVESKIKKSMQEIDESLRILDFFDRKKIFTEDCE